MKVIVKYYCLRLVFMNQKMLNLVFVGGCIYIIIACK